MEVSREVTFKASHSHKGMLFEPVHEHEFKVRIVMEGERNEEGFVCDFRAVKRIFNKVVGKEVINRNLDELLEFPTSENLAQWMWHKLEPFFPLTKIEVKEKPHSIAVYTGK